MSTPAELRAQATTFRDESSRAAVDKAEELGVPLEEHIQFVIEALRPVERELGLGQPA